MSVAAISSTPAYTPPLLIGCDGGFGVSLVGGRDCRFGPGFVVDCGSFRCSLAVGQDRGFGPGFVDGCDGPRAGRRLQGQERPYLANQG